MRRKYAKKAKDDPKVFRRFVQSKTKIKGSNIQCIIDDNGEIHIENKCKAELLNAFFQNVFPEFFLQMNLKRIPYQLSTLERT